MGKRVGCGLDLDQARYLVQSEAKVIAMAVASQNKKWALLNSNNFFDNTEDGIINLDQVKGPLPEAGTLLNHRPFKH